MANAAPGRVHDPFVSNLIELETLINGRENDYAVGSSDPRSRSRPEENDQDTATVPKIDKGKQKEDATPTEPEMAVTLKTFRVDDDQVQSSDSQSSLAYNSGSSSTNSWHPKITPYRLLNVLIPIGIGTSKAIVSLKGGSTAPVTLELVLGVVVFLTLFHAGYYESNHPPRSLAWAFQTDCMEFLRLLLHVVSIPRPLYRSEEHFESDVPHIATSYRLLVSSVITAAGLTKASLTYAGFSIGPIWIEWLFGVLVSSILYIIGLYEGSSAGMWRTFFRVGHDRHYVTIYIQKKVTYSLLISLGVFCLHWTPTPEQRRKQLIGSEFQEPIRLPQTMYPNTILMLPVVIGLGTGVVSLSLGLLGGLSDIPGSEMLAQRVWSYISNHLHTIGHLLVFVTGGLFVGFSFLIPLSLSDALKSGPGGMSIEEVFLRGTLWTGFLVMWGFIFGVMWWSLKAIARDISRSLRPILFPLVLRRLAEINYAFWEMGEAFQTSPV